MMWKLFALWFSLVPASLMAQTLPSPGGMVILTASGDIGVANRGEPSFLQDPFLAFHEVNFDEAAEFDFAMLEGLDMQSTELRLSKWPEPSLMEGPSLKSLLAAVKAPLGSGVSFVALDGFRAELSVEDIESHDWIAAIKRDGKPLGIGAHGPVWVIFPPAAEDHTANRDE